MLRGAPANSPSRRIRVDNAVFTAPIAGWISNRALAIPLTADQPQGADRLDNFFPTATGCILRRGSQAYAQISNDGSQTVSLFKYIVGENIRMFAATDTTIYDISTVVNPENFSISLDDEETLIIDDDNNTIGDNSTENLAVYNGTTSGDWTTVQFGTTGGIYLIGVNGVDEAFIFDGTDFYPFGASDVYKINFDTQTAEFTIGDTVTGGTSAATGTIANIIKTSLSSGRLILTNVTGTFQNNEILTGSSGGSATSVGAAQFAVSAITFPAEYDLTTADLSFVWIYKQALYFAEKNSLRSWYLEPDMQGGELKPYFLNGWFDKGGSLLWGQSWSLASSDQGGLSAQNVFTTTEGESAVFQGISPSDSTWGMVGVYRVGRPLGKHGFMRAGGDLMIATDVGYIALSKAQEVDFAALAPNAVSYPIEVAWNEAISSRGRDWHCEIWAEGQMAIVIPPVSDVVSSSWFVSNASTGAWSQFTGWTATCVLEWNGRLFFGTPDGYVIEAMVGGTDQGDPFTGVYVPLFSDCGKPTQQKVARMVRAESKSGFSLNEKVSVIFDFDNNIPSPPSASIVSVGNEWDNAIWNSSLWDTNRNAVITKRRHSASGHGYRIAPVFQITSASPVPLDVELITLDVIFETGTLFS